MILFQTPATLLFLASAALVWCGTGGRKGHILSFLGGLGFALGCVWALVDGASLQELLLAAMAMFLLSMAGGRRDT